MATFYNITGNQGDHLQLTLNLKDSFNNLINLNGYGVRGQVRTSYGATGILLNLNPIISGDGSSGVVSINIDSYISKNIPIGVHLYDIERYPIGDEDGNVIKILQGKFSILPEITR